MSRTAGPPATAMNVVTGSGKITTRRGENPLTMRPASLPFYLLQFHHDVCFLPPLAHTTAKCTAPRPTPASLACVARHTCTLRRPSVHAVSYECRHKLQVDGTTIIATRNEGDGRRAVKLQNNLEGEASGA